MALRVLLADESATIKKVIQLALQDFAVEVKSVAVGTDVAGVARQFQPDIVFADVLLTKKNGYEVSRELKEDARLKDTPVVLMWSGFLELDERKMRECGANHALEKPFDAEQLRQIVRNLVKKTQNQPLAAYIKFPDLPEIIESPDELLKKKSHWEQHTAELAKTNQEPFITAPVDSKRPETDNAHLLAQLPPVHDQLAVEELDEFKSVPLPGAGSRSDVLNPAPEDAWMQAGLEQFRVGDLASDLNIDEVPTPDLLELQVASTDNDQPIDLFAIEEQSTAGHSVWDGGEKIAVQTTRDGLDPVRAEEILRETAREVLESVAWKIMPDLIERIVREEVAKLVKEAERLS